MENPIEGQQVPSTSMKEKENGGMLSKHSMATGSAHFLSDNDRDIGRMQSLAQLSQLAISSSSIDEVVDAGMAVLVGGLDMDYAKLLRLLDGHAGLKVQWGVGWNRGCVGEVIVPPDTRSQAGFTLTQTGPVVVQDFRSETRFEAPALLVQHRVRSGMSVTVHDRSKPFGVIGVHCRNQRSFSRSDIVFLHSVGQLISAAVSQRERSQSMSGDERSDQVRRHSPEDLAPTGRVLRGWKEIAAYMGSGVRTAQRWELKYALPVHRPAAKLRSCVVSSPSELDAWVQRSPTRE
jgi:transcriptional regulator with GAF, ATPase, and Fis domain